MTDTLNSYVASQLAAQLKQRRIVVWYDSRSEFGPFMDQLVGNSAGGPPVEVDVAGLTTSVVTDNGSRYSTRFRVEPLVAVDEPGYVVVYLPDGKRSLDDSVLMELETAGVSWEPQLRQLARNVLRQRFTDGVIDELLGRESTTYADVAAALATEGLAPPSALKSLLPGSGGNAQIARWISNEAIDAEVEAKQAGDELRKLMASRLAIDLEGTDLPKWRRIVARTALGLEFRSDLAGAPPAQLASLPASTAEIDRNARAICAALRATHIDAYPELADRVASELQLNKESIDALQLGEIDTFRFEEQALFSRCGELIRDGQYGRVMEITAQRAGSFWLTQSIERQAQWEAIRLAAELGSAADAVDADLAKPPRTVEEWVDRYATSWHLLDRAQRQLEAWLPKLDDDPDEIAINAVRRRYDATLERIAVGFGKALQDANWDCSPVLQQTSVFQDFVKPAQGRVAYFLVDAMRYEMGTDLAARLEGLGEVSIRPAISVLPSITTTGMAALMPGAAHSYDVVDDHGKLVARVDGNPLPDLNARKKHFAARFPASIDFELGEMLQLTRKNLEKKIGKADVVVVRSQDIDKFGEGGGYLARTVMNTVIDNIVQAVRKLADVGIPRAVIASDHGHIYASREREEAMRIDAPGGATVELHRRCWIGRGGTTPPATVRVSASNLGNDSDLDFVFPKGCGVFRAGGDLAFHHGGASLEETVIPVITFRPASIAADERARTGAQLEVLEVPAAITNRIFSVKLLFATMQPPPVRPVLVSGERRVGTVGMAVGGQLDRTTGIVKVPTGEGATIGFQLNDDAVQSVRIVVLDPKSDAELYRSPNEIPVQLGVA
jgi:hypothetical protein